MGTSASDTAPDRVQVDAVPYGPNALEALATAVSQAKQGDPLRAVTVVVPTKVSGLALRRALSSRPGGSVGVGFLVEAQLAELLAATELAERGRRPLTSAVRTEVVRESLRRVPGALGDLARHPATARVADRAFSAIREATAVTGEADLLDALRHLGGLRSTLADVYGEFRRLTAPTRYDEHDLALLAARSVERDAGVLRDIGAVIVYLPTRVTPAGAHLVRSLSQVTPVRILLGRTGDPAADDVTDALGRRYAPGRTAAAPAAPARPRVDAVVVPDAEEEARHAVRLVTRAMLDGQDPARIAIVYRAKEPYATLVHELLQSAGIPHNGPTERTLAQTLAGRFLVDVWRWARDGHPRAELFDVLGSVPVRWHDGRVPTPRWDRIAREARVLGGRAHWDQRLEGAAAAQERRIAVEAPSDWLADRLRQEAQDARDLRTFVLDLADRLQPPQPGTWSAWSTWTLELLDRCLGVNRSAWPEADIEAEGTIRQLLTNLAQLDGLRDEMGLPARSVAEDEAFSAISEALADPAGRVGRAGTGVYVGPLGTAGTVDVDRVLVLGAVEGSFPPRARENVLLPDAVIDELHARADAGTPLAAALEDLPTAAGRVASARQAFQRALASSTHATITVPRADRREQRARVPAPWLLELLSDRAGRRVTVEDVLEHPEAVPHLTAVASRVAGLLAAPAPAGVTERRLQLLTHHVDAGHDLTNDAIVADTPGLLHGIHVQRARAGDELTTYDGHVPDAQDVLRQQLERPQASSILAEYATCPRRYLLARVLGVRTSDEPRQWLDIDALDRGVLVHETLEQWVGEQLVDGPAPPPGVEPGTPGRLFAILDGRIDQLERTGRIGLPALWEREKIRLRARLERWLEQDRELRQTYDVQPVAVELAFGMGDESLNVPTAGGAILRLRGRIDRIDADAERTRVVVTDYKTARPGTYASLDEDIAQAGSELQLPVYGLAAARRFPEAQIHVGYWHVHDDAKRPPVLVPFGPEERARTQQVLDTLADAITAGVFFAVPGDETMWPAPGFTNCRYCPFDTICPSHGQRLRAAQRDAASTPARRLLPLYDPSGDGGDR